jgi:hypothetical protein
LLIALGFLQNSLGRGSSSSLEGISSLLEGISSSLKTYLGEDEPLIFTYFLLSFSMRPVCLERLGKSDLLDEDSPLMTIVAKSSFSDSELSSLESHSCSI